MIFTKLRMLALTLALILSVSGAYGVQLTAGTTGNGISSGVSLGMNNAPQGGAVDGTIVMSKGIAQPTVTGCGDFDPTYSIQDASGKRAEVYANIAGADSYSWVAFLTYLGPQIGGIPLYHIYYPPATDTSLVLPGTTSALTAEQQLSASGADAIHTYAAAYTSYDVPAANRYPVAKVSLDVTDASGKASVTGLDQVATVSSDASGTYARSAQVAEAGGDRIERHANSEQSPSSYHDLTMVIDGLTVNKELHLSDEANVNSINDLGHKSSMENLNLESATAVKMTLSDHRNTAERGERRVTMTSTDGHIPDGSAFSQKTTHILKDLVESSLVGDGDLIEVENLGYLYPENVKIDKSVTIKGINTPEIHGLTVGSTITTGAINKNAIITLDNLEITHGFATLGGAINNFATLTVKNSKIHDNIAAASGAIMNEPGAKLTVDSTEIYNNQGIAKDSDGGAIFNAGEMHIKDSNIHDNIADWGGAIYNYDSSGKSDILGTTTISKNTANREGGAVLNSQGSQLKIGDDAAVITMDGNKAQAGGAISNYGKVWVTKATITNNEANAQYLGKYIGDGGGIFSGLLATGPSPNVELHVDSCTISGNKAAFGAGIYTADTSGKSGIKNSIMENNRLLTPVPWSPQYGGAIMVQGGAGAFFDIDPATRAAVNSNDHYQIVYWTKGNLKSKY